MSFVGKHKMNAVFADFLISWLNQPGFVWTTKFEMCKVDDDDGQYRYLLSR